jgi:hypothetical protein
MGDHLPLAISEGYENSLQVWDLPCGGLGESPPSMGFTGKISLANHLQPVGGDPPRRWVVGWIHLVVGTHCRENY